MQRITCQYCKTTNNTVTIQFYPNESVFNVCINCLHKAIKEQNHLRGKIAFSRYPENFFEHKKIPIDFLNANTWMVNENQRFMLSNWNMIKKRNLGKGIIFYGDVGVGKTYMLYAFMKDVCMYAGKMESLFISEGDFFNDFKRRMNEAVIYGRDFLEKASEADLIFYDDLGSQIKTISGDWGKEKLLALISLCSDQNKPLIISTNIKKEYYETYFGARTADRLNSLEYVELRDYESARKPISQS